MEMLSETDQFQQSHRLNKLVGLPAGRVAGTPSACGWRPTPHGTTMGSGPDSSQNLCLTSHQQPALDPRHLKHKSQGTTPILGGDPKEAPSISCIHHWQCGYN